MMLTWLAERTQDREASAAAKAIEAAVEVTLRDRRFHTADLGGTASTAAVGDFVAAQIAKATTQQ
jgi:isocitrate/isopropylmalate dehydrogenase